MALLQIKNVPDEVHSALKARAAREGTTMSELVLEQLPRIAAGESLESVIDRIRSRDSVTGTDPVELIRADRDSR